MMAMRTGVASIIAVLFVFQQIGFGESNSLGIERRPLGYKESQTVTATFIGRFNHSEGHYGFTTVEDKIYVVNHWPNRIRVFDGFRLLEEIPLFGMINPRDIVYSSESKCVYISDTDRYWHKSGRSGSIWKMATTDDHRLTKWLTNVTYMYGLTISLSSEGHLLVMKSSRAFDQGSLEIYDLNSTLIRTIHLPKEFRGSNGVVQESTGDFVIMHDLSNTYDSSISRLTNDGKLTNRFKRENLSKEFEDHAMVYTDLSLDSENNRLFVAAPFTEFQVIVVDLIDLTSTKILGLEEMKKLPRLPFILHYDARKRQLFVTQRHRFVAVYEIS